MTKMHKVLILVLIVLMAASSMVTVGNIAAEVPKPAVPEFTIRIVAHPYDVPTTYSKAIHW